MCGLIFTKTNTLLVLCNFVTGLINNKLIVTELSSGIIMATRKPVSYRTGRDYSTHFTWTYELNKDVYDCYTKARSDPSKGYTKRLKQYWDELHPQYSHFNEKQLRQQAVNVEKKQNTLAANLCTRREPNESDEQIEIVDETIETIEEIIVSENNTPNNPVNVDVNVVDDEILLSSLRERFTTHVEKYRTLELRQREYTCNTSRSITNQECNAMNVIIHEFLSNTDEPVDLWLINVLQYSAIVTLLEKHNQLKERKHVLKARGKPNWQKHCEEKIANLQRKISFIDLITNCRTNNTTLTQKQQQVERKLRRWYGNTRSSTLLAKSTELKHELRVAASHLKHKLKIDERNRINRTFETNQKVIFRGWKSKKVDVTNPPSEEGISNFWSGIWCNEKQYNRDATWLGKLDESYCSNIVGKDYEMTNDLFQKVLSKMKNGAPGRDLIRSFWIKKLVATHAGLLDEYKLIFNGEKDIPQWLALCMTILLPKNTDTNNPKNYRPIACQNTTYKLFTGIVYTFFEDHCTSNNIITMEQAGGKKGSWGCTDQLLINKMVLDEVTAHRRNLFTMWFDYKKAFDMIAHDWLIKSLELAKIPTKLINVVKMLMQKWSVIISLNHSEGNIETDTLKYLNGLLQGGCLSLILFELCINPLSHLLNDLPGYKLGKPGERDLNLSHLFFVDDLKTFATDVNTAKMQLDLITTFTNDIGMEFGADKCAYLLIQNGERSTLGSVLTMNGLELSELKDGDSYKYLGMDEDIAIIGEINKEKVRSEYFRRVRKIWNSELYCRHKITAHNTFAIPVITPTFGILTWSKEELQQIDVKTRKLLTLSGSFHLNSDVDRLYCQRNEGGRGLNSVDDTYICRITSLNLHLDQMENKNPYLAKVKKHEARNIVRQGAEFQLSYDEQSVTDPKIASKNIKLKIKNDHLKSWTSKAQHGFLFKTRERITDIDHEKSNYWLTKSSTTSHVEGYICAIQEEEINTRGLQKRRANDVDRQNTNYRCRVCHQDTETIQHLLACCDRLRISMYLPVRHNAVASVIYHELTMSKSKEILTVYKDENIELWWDTKIPTKPSLPHNKPDLVLWRLAEKKVFVIDVVVGLDVNVEKNYKTKLDNYLPLCIELKKTIP